jgi:hypothetical protein
MNGLNRFTCMRRIKMTINAIRRIILSLTIALASGGVGLHQAQAAAAPGTTPVHPRALIPPLEVAEYRRAMKAAPTLEAKRAVREATYAHLRQRAVKQGLTMREPLGVQSSRAYGTTVDRSSKATAGGHGAERRPLVVTHPAPRGI